MRIVPARRYVTYDQIEVLLECLEANVGVARSDSWAINRVFGVPKFWAEASHKLNAVKEGCHKTPKDWQKYWSEIKYRAKKKAQTNQANRPGMKPLNKYEIKVLKIIGEPYDPDEYYPELPPQKPSIKRSLRTSRRLAENDPLTVNVKNEPEYSEIEVLDTDALDDDDGDDYEPPETSNSSAAFGEDTPAGRAPETHSGDAAEAPSGDLRWVRDVEERKISVSERIAATLESLSSAMLGVQGSLNTMMEEIREIKNDMRRPPIVVPKTSSS